MIRVRLGISALCGPNVLLIISISTTDLMQFLGMLGFYLHLSHICSALRLTSTWGSDFFCSSCGWAPPAAGACWGCFFVDWWWWSRSFNHSDVLFPCNINSHHLYCSLVKEDVPALIWAVQHFEVYSHQRLECDKHTQSDPWPGDQWQSVFFSIWSRVTFSVRELTRSLGEVFSSGLLHSLTPKLDSHL